MSSKVIFRKRLKMEELMSSLGLELNERFLLQSTSSDDIPIALFSFTVCSESGNIMLDIETMGSDNHFDEVSALNSILTGQCAVVKLGHIPTCDEAFSYISSDFSGTHYGRFEFAGEWMTRLADKNLFQTHTSAKNRLEQMKASVGSTCKEDSIFEDAHNKCTGDRVVCVKSQGDKFIRLKITDEGIVKPSTEKYTDDVLLAMKEFLTGKATYFIEPDEYNEEFGARIIR